MQTLGVLTLMGYMCSVHHATFRRIADDGQGNAGWEFNVCAQPPADESLEADDVGLFDTGVRFYAEGDPIPLPDRADFTGFEMFLEEPYDPESGEMYFTLYLGEHRDVSDVRLRFVERRGSDYRIQVSAMAHDLLDEPTKLEIDTWITQLPAGRYGAA